jgi:hypothetical protein
MLPLRTASLAFSLAAALALAAGCSSASSSLGNTAATASPAHATVTSSPATSSPATSSPATSSPAPSSPAAGSATQSAATPSSASPASAVSGSSQPAGAGRVYFAESGDVNGTVVFEPSCRSGCELSGDGTTALWNMTWSTWNGTEAVGSGTEKLDDCTPDCAAGTLHAVPVTVTFSKPVKASCRGTTRLYWTSMAFTWPNGLPAAFSGQNAPLNPFTYPGIGGSGGCA